MLVLRADDRMRIDIWEVPIYAAAVRESGQLDVYVGQFGRGQHFLQAVLARGSMRLDLAQMMAQYRDRWKAFRDTADGRMMVGLGAQARDQVTLCGDLEHFLPFIRI